MNQPSKLQCVSHHWNELYPLEKLILIGFILTSGFTLGLGAATLLINYVI